MFLGPRPVFRRVFSFLATLTIASSGIFGGVPAIGPASTVDAQTPPVNVPPYVVIGPNGQAIARFITSASTCPNVDLAGISIPMQVRAAAGPNFPVLTCESPIPAKVFPVTIAGRQLPLIPDSPKRVAILGDTGCRMATQNRFQACNDPELWPYKKVSESIAAYKPDIIIHLGDFHYREVACPAGNAGCAGSPIGFGWDVWNLDFFEPARATLTAAPWIMVRGNHEDCTRAWDGWFRFLDPFPYKPGCPEFTEPYVMPFNGLNMVMLDSASAVDAAVDAKQVPVYEQQLATVSQLSGNNAWLLTHKPIYGVDATAPGQAPDIAATNMTIAAAAKNGYPAGIKGIFAGHIHLFAALSFAAQTTTGRPSQWIIGNGGAQLDPAFTLSFDSLRIAGETLDPASGLATDAFGFSTFEPLGGDQWAVTARDRNGYTMVNCGFAGKAASCKK